MSFYIKSICFQLECQECNRKYTNLSQHIAKVKNVNYTTNNYANIIYGHRKDMDIRFIIFRQRRQIIVKSRYRALLRHNTEISKQTCPGKELGDYSPNFYIPVFVSDFYVPLIGLPILV
jgi:hypothetical protein